MKQIFKKFSATIGLFVFLFLLAAIPGSKADAATLKVSGKVETVGPITATENGEWHKLTMKESGYIYITALCAYQDAAPSWNLCDITVYNSNRKSRLSDVTYTNFESSINSQVQHLYALKAGTYYIKVKMRSAVLTGYAADGSMITAPNKYAIISKVKYLTESKTGSTKKKAVAMKLGSTKQGILSLTDARSSKNGSAGDWYKFTLSKKMKVKLTVSGESTKKIQILAIGATTLTKLQSLLDGKTTTLSKGTYYIRLYKTTKTDSGWYRLKLVKKQEGELGYRKELIN